ncbi:hypothetical protein BKA81DRAFT_379380 [Phyllosticta paracitricarpa]
MGRVHPPPPLREIVPRLKKKLEEEFGRCITAEVVEAMCQEASLMEQDNHVNSVVFIRWIGGQFGDCSIIKKKKAAGARKRKASESEPDQPELWNRRTNAPLDEEFFSAFMYFVPIQRMYSLHKCAFPGEILAKDSSGHGRRRLLWGMNQVTVSTRQLLLPGKTPHHRVIISRTWRAFHSVASLLISREKIEWASSLQGFQAESSLVNVSAIVFGAQINELIERKIETAKGLLQPAPRYRDMKEARQDIDRQLRGANFQYPRLARRPHTCRFIFTLRLIRRLITEGRTCLDEPDPNEQIASSSAISATDD